MIVEYEYIHRFGDNLHRITIYKEWDGERAKDKVIDNSGTNFQTLYGTIWKFIPKEARKAVKKAAQRKTQLLILDDKGETLKRFE